MRLYKEIEELLFQHYKDRVLKKGQVPRVLRDILTLFCCPEEYVEESVESCISRIRNNPSFEYINLIRTPHAKQRAKERGITIPDKLAISTLSNGLSSITDKMEKVKIRYSNQYDIILVVGNYNEAGTAAEVKTVYTQRKVAPAKIRNNKAKRLKDGKIVKRRRRHKGKY